jgi:hypothetical protein
MAEPAITLQTFAASTEGMEHLFQDQVDQVSRPLLFSKNLLLKKFLLSISDNIEH